MEPLATGTAAGREPAGQQPQARLRTRNDRAFAQVLLLAGGLTRRQLASSTGLSTPAATKIVNRLRADGVVELDGARDTGRPGPRADLVRLATGLGLATGIEVRPHELRVMHRPLDDPAPDEVHEVPLDPTVDLVTQLQQALELGAGAQPHRHRTVCVAAPGVLDPETADVFRDSGLAQWKPGHSRRISDALGCPVEFENDVNLHAVAERTLGAAGDLDDFLLASYGMGVGAAVVMDGRVRRGAHGAAGEVGLLPTGAGSTHYLDVAGTWLDEEDRPLAEPPWPTVAAAIGQGLASAVLLVDPAAIVLAGPLCLRGGRELRDLVARHLEASLPWHIPEVRLSALGEDAVLLGARLRAQSRLLDLLFDPDAP